MIAFPSMLLDPAKQAGMKTPCNADDFDPEEFPHFHVFCILQLARPIRMGEQWDNARVLAAIPEAELKTMTLADFLAKGLEWRT